MNDVSFPTTDLLAAATQVLADGGYTLIPWKRAAVEELDEQIAPIVENVVEESTEVVLLNYTKDDGRKNKLKNALMTDLRSLFIQSRRRAVMSEGKKINR